MTERERIAWTRLDGYSIAGLELHQEWYGNGRPALQAFTDEGEPFATVTVNLVNRELGEGEFFVKCELSDFGGADLLHALVESGLAYPTGKTVSEGFSERYAEIWRLAL